MGKTASRSGRACIAPRGVKRTLAMLQRAGNGPPVVFAGGVAHNPCVRKLLEDGLGHSLLIAEQPDFVGALGAALSRIKNSNST